MFSADHYDSEQKLTMTDMAEVIKSSDKVFNVKFRKQLDQSNVQKLLKEGKPIQGQLVSITGYLIENNENFGRSVIWDLNSKMVK